MKDKITEIRKMCAGLKAHDLAAHFLRRHGDHIALASSMGAEDQVLTDMIMKVSREARIFVIDTGKFFSETRSLISKTEKHYGMKYEIYKPDEYQVSEMISRHGDEQYYKSVELRRECCRVRKIEPLKRVLSTLDVWITGLRASQSITRANTPSIEWDDDHGLIKVNPLIGWTNEDVWDYIRNNDVPYNELHDRGFPSIGCEPCTRAVEEGGDIRAGRWWWEMPEHRECGLHSQEGKERENGSA